MYLLCTFCAPFCAPFVLVKPRFVYLVYLFLGINKNILNNIRLRVFVRKNKTNPRKKGTMVHKPSNYGLFGYTNGTQKVHAKVHWS